MAKYKNNINDSSSIPVLAGFGPCRVFFTSQAQVVAAQVSQVNRR